MEKTIRKNRLNGIDLTKAQFKCHIYLYGKFQSLKGRSVFRKARFERNHRFQQCFPNNRWVFNVFNNSIQLGSEKVGEKVEKSAWIPVKQPFTRCFSSFVRVKGLFGRWISRKKFSTRQLSCGKPGYVGLWDVSGPIPCGIARACIPVSWSSRRKTPFFFVKALVILDIDFVALYAFEVTPEPS